MGALHFFIGFIVARPVLLSFTTVIASSKNTLPNTFSRGSNSHFSTCRHRLFATATPFTGMVPLLGQICSAFKMLIATWSRFFFWIIGTRSSGRPGLVLWFFGQGTVLSTCILEKSSFRLQTWIIGFTHPYCKGIMPIFLNNCTMSETVLFILRRDVWVG